MKYFYQILIITAAFAISSCSSSRYYQGNPDEYSQNYDEEPTITYQQFYNDLSPYGNWVYYGNYGYVWVPGVANFRPYYSNGHWVYTDYGWTWVSDYSWGWAPFHYGRWINDYNYGWMWIPGYQWAPAWVSWRSGGNYYGWAPLGPGMDANISVGSIPYNDWTFVPGRYITSPRINNYYVNRSRNVTIINNTTIINNNIYERNNNGRNNPVYNPGPSVTQVEQTTGSRVRKYNVVQANKPQASQINNNSIRVFRPAVNQQTTTSGENPRPPKVMDINQIRNTRGNTTNQTNNTNNENRQPAASVREFPKNQTPQINRNEPPVNNNQPSVTPERNNTPARVFPRVSNEPEQPARNNPVPPTSNQVPANTNSTPANNQPTVNPNNNNNNNTPVRRFPNQRQFNRNGQQANQVSPTPAQPEPQRKDERLRIPNNRPNNPQPNQPARQFNTQRPMPSNPNNNRNEQQVERRRMEPAPNPPATRENTEKHDQNPAQPVREFH